MRTALQTAFAGVLFVLLGTGCVTTGQPVHEAQIPDAASTLSYTPTELTGKSTEQLRTELEDALAQTLQFNRLEPDPVIFGRAKRVEMGEDYVFIRFEGFGAVAPTSYGFMFERLAELSLSDETCGHHWATLPDTVEMRVARTGPAVGRAWCDILYTLGLRAKRQLEADEARFAQLAVQARGSDAKMTESLRQLLVQAEVLREEKNYVLAAATLRKAIRNDPVTYPAAHFNLALLYEIMGDYRRAIASMQHYLALKPNATDAREAQDKIYALEMKANRR